MRPIVVAGHLCLDLFPAIASEEAWSPGRLVETGPLMVSTGGAVANVGLALYRLGHPVRLRARLGTDPLSATLRGLIPEGLLTARASRGTTSYTVVLSPPGRDRTFLHHPGGNDEFGPEDLDDALLTGAGHLHFGYPPLMRRMYGEAGTLGATLRRAKEAGLTTSLDLSLPDRDSDSGRADWRLRLAETLPYVDLFVPSVDELAYMLGTEDPAELNRESRTLGAKEVILKMGSEGLWHERHRQPVFPIEVVGTTGSGDATIAGLLYGWTQGWPLERALRLGAAAGAASCGRADAVSGIPPYDELAARYGLA